MVCVIVKVCGKVKKTKYVRRLYHIIKREQKFVAKGEIRRIGKADQKQNTI